jgi:hypothetical protein
LGREFQTMITVGSCVGGTLAIADPQGRNAFFLPASTVCNDALLAKMR